MVCNIFSLTMKQILETKRETHNIIVNTMLCFGYREEKTKTSMESITCLSWLCGGWFGFFVLFWLRGRGTTLNVFFFFFFSPRFFFFLNSELNKKKKTHAKRHRFSGSNDSNNWVVTVSWIDNNWKVEDWIDKTES